MGRITLTTTINDIALVGLDVTVDTLSFVMKVTLTSIVGPPAELSQTIASSLTA